MKPLPRLLQTHYLLWGGVSVLLLSIVSAVAIGPAKIAPLDVLRAIGAHFGLMQSGLSPVRDAIIWELRLPRVLAAGAVGAGLALSGTVMQAVTRNPLADPYLLGLSAGASLGAVMVLILGVTVLLPVAAFSGAILALLATLGLSRSLGQITPARTVLSGVAVSAFAAAFGSFLIFWNVTGDSYREILSWLMGSLGGATWHAAAISISALVIVGIPVALTGRTLDAFTFGEAAAAALGIEVERARWVLLLSTALLTGAMVSVSGSVGFVGLIIPHAVRLLVGGRHKLVLPLAALGGAITLVWADTFARAVFDPRELPVGIVTALLGAPVFAVLLWSARRST